jgi:hypothetical protein
VTDNSRHQGALRRLRSLFAEVVGGLHLFRMFVSGSYRLGIHSEDTDIDVVFVVAGAPHLTRSWVFNALVGALQRADGVADLQPVPQARVPVIGVVLDGQEFDIMTCHMAAGREAGAGPSAPPPPLPSRDALLTTYTWLNGLDEASILSFSGPRVTEMLLALVPAMEAYLVALRYLRVWAKRRGIYSNRSGYLGGINLALFACFVAQKHPGAGAALLVTKVFETFARWKWARENPVALEDTTGATAGPCPPWLQALDWATTSGRAHPGAGGGAQEAMTLLTPCFPRTNSLFTTSTFSRRVMARELERGAGLLASASTSPTVWEIVAAPHVLFATCPRFLRVRILADDSPRGRTWQGYMESQVRHLILFLSKEELAVREFRYIPKWVAYKCPATGASVRETYITAEDDGKPRTYPVRGTIHGPKGPLAHFMHLYLGAGPPVPPGVATVTADLVPARDVRADMLGGASSAADLQRLAAKERELLQAAGGALALPPPRSQPATPTPTRPTHGGASTSPHVHESALTLEGLWSTTPPPTSVPLEAPAFMQRLLLLPEEMRLKPRAAEGASGAKPPTLLAHVAAASGGAPRVLVAQPRPAATASLPPPPKRWRGPVPPAVQMVPRLSYRCFATTRTPIDVPTEMYIGRPWRSLAALFPELECPLARRDFPSTKAWQIAYREQLVRALPRSPRLRDALVFAQTRTLVCWCVCETECHAAVLREMAMGQWAHRGF